MHPRLMRKQWVKSRMAILGESYSFQKVAFQIFANIEIESIGFPTSASVRPHKKAVKKIETEGAKEKQLLPKLGGAIGP
jgi:hypothetical protein